MSKNCLSRGARRWTVAFTVGTALATGCSSSETSPAPAPQTQTETKANSIEMVSDLDKAIRTTARTIACILAQPQTGAKPNGIDKYDNTGYVSTQGFDVTASGQRFDFTDLRRLSATSEDASLAIHSRFIPKPDSPFFFGQVDLSRLEASLADMDAGLSLGVSSDHEDGNNVIFYRNGENDAENIGYRVHDENGEVVAEQPRATREELDKHIMQVDRTMEDIAAIGGGALMQCFSREGSADPRA